MKDRDQPADRKVSGLDRREFLVGSALGVGVMGLASCAGSRTGDTLRAGAAASGAADAARPPAF